MGRFRLLAISVMSAGLGGLATVGLRLLDSRSNVAAIVGGGAVVVVSLALDVARVAVRVRAVIEDVRAARANTDGLHERLDVVEVKLAGITPPAPRSSSAGRTGSYPAL